MTADRYCSVWQDRHPRPDAQTTEHNRLMVRRFGVDFAGRTLASIAPEEVRAWAQLGNASALRYVRAMLSDAVGDGLLPVNPAAKLGVPAGPSRRDKEVPELGEVEALLAACGARTAALVHLSAFAGPRQSEALALEWDDLDLDGRVCHLRRQLARDGSVKPILKGKSTRRDIRLPTATCELLGALERTSPRVWPFGHRALRTWWDRARADAGVRVEWMQLRTHCASWLLDNGATPIDVAHQLHGRSDPRTVLQYYAMQDRKLAAERLAEVMG